MRHGKLTALSFIALSTSALAGKPSHGGGGGGSTSTTDPQVAYVHISASGTREIRLANEDGTGSAVLATSSQSDVAVRLAPRAQHQLAYTSGPSVHLLTYEITSTGVRTVSDVVVGSDTVGTLAFSPTGTQIAWLNPDGNVIYLEDLGSGSTVQLVNSGSAYIADIDFSSDGSHLIYSQTIPPSTTDVQFKSIPVAGGDSIDLPISGAYFTFRVGHTSDSIAAASWGSNGPITFFPAGSSSGSVLVNGLHPALRCDDRVLMYMTTSRSSEKTLKYDLTTGLGSTFGTAAYFPDYFPDC
jgi:Tol biopolymer transport system component